MVPAMGARALCQNYRQRHAIWIRVWVRVVVQISLAVNDC